MQRHTCTHDPNSICTQMILLKRQTIKELLIGINTITVWVSIAVKRHQDQTKAFTCGGSLTIQRFSPLSSWWEAGQHRGRHSAGEGAESSYI